MATPQKSRASDASAPDSLVERVRERVASATSRLDHGGHGGRRRSTDTSEQNDTKAPEVWALRWVFRDMGRTQRAMRRESGQAPFRGVRTAAIAFRRAPSLNALVGVAASLEEVNLLGW